MLRNVSVGCQVYGAPDGAVAFLDVPEGVIPPPAIAHLAYLGAVHDVVTLALNRLRDQQRARSERPWPQRALAGILGTRQQYISRWSNAECAPELSDGQWAKLVRIVQGVELPDRR
jgi:hypothetical protein